MRGQGCRRGGSEWGVEVRTGNPCSMTKDCVRSQGGGEEEERKCIVRVLGSPKKSRRGMKCWMSSNSNPMIEKNIGDVDGLTELVAAST
jgi:hypothetical protein